MKVIILADGESGLTTAHAFQCLVLLFDREIQVTIVAFPEHISPSSNQVSVHLITIRLRQDKVVDLIQNLKEV